MRLFVRFQLMLQRKRHVTPFVSTDERLGSCRQMRSRIVFAEKVSLGERLVTLVARVYFSRVVHLLVTTKVWRGPKLLVATGARACELFVIRVLVCAHVSRQVGCAQVCLVALGTGVRAFTSVRACMLSQAGGLKVRLGAAGEDACEAAFGAGWWARRGT